MLLSKFIAHLCPDPLIAFLYQLCIGPQSLGLCLHRVCQTRRLTDPYPPNTIEEEKLAKILALIERHHRLGHSHLTLTFDDGYQDALVFVRHYAGLYPHLRFCLFVCPKKLEKRLGFRWDRYELALHGASDPILQTAWQQQNPGQPLPGIQAGETLLRHITSHSDPKLEEMDASLQGIADLQPFKMASIEDLRKIQSLPNVKLGNHGNAHLKLALLDQNHSVHDIQSSIADMGRLFGSAADFAFPFGTPTQDYQAAHVEILRKHGVQTIWSTYSTAYGADEARPGAVLPRFVIIGIWTHKRIVAYLALVSLLARFRRSGPVTEYLALSKSS